MTASRLDGGTINVSPSGLGPDNQAGLPAPAVRAQEGFPVAEQLLREDAAGVAVPLDEFGGGLEARVGPLPRDLDEVREDAEDVVLRHDTEEAAVLHTGR